MFTGNAVAATTVYFNSDFESAIDTGTSIVDSSGTLTQVFGDLSLSAFGSMPGTVRVFNPNTESYEQARLALGGGANKYKIEFDIETQNLVGSTTSPFTSSGGDVDSLRFSLSPALGGAGIDTNVSVAIDNLVVTRIPVPAALWLFLSGSLGLLSIGRSRKKS